MVEYESCLNLVDREIHCRTFGTTYSIVFRLLKIKIKTINFILDVSSLL